MPNPAFTFYENDSTPSGGTPITTLNPTDFGILSKGTISPIVTIHVWNDKDGSLGSSTAIAPRFYAISGPGNAADIFAGTAINNFKSMLEARSCGAFNVAADQDQDWTPVSPTSLLELGDMPSNTRRDIELRMNIPIDALTLATIDFTMVISG